MLTELDPKPDQVTIAIGSSLYDMTPLTTLDDLEGTHLANPQMVHAMSNMVADSTPDFYVEHLKRLEKSKIQPYFALATVHQLQIVERLIRQGIYKGPMNGFFSMVGGGVAGSNPIDWMELIRRTPHGSVWTYQTMWRYSWPLAIFCITMGQHTRAGIEENLWGTQKGGPRMTSVQMIEKQVRMARELGREIATGGRCPTNPQNRHLVQLCGGDTFQSRLAAESPEWSEGFLSLRYKRQDPYSRAKFVTLDSSYVESDAMWAQIQNELLDRIHGPLDFRLILQPVVAAVLAIRSGVRDSKERRTPFLLTILRSPEQRGVLMNEGWKDIGRVFILACLIDVAFQIIALKTLRPGQMLLVAFLLSIVPYSLVRGLANRLAGLHLLAISPGKDNRE